MSTGYHLARYLVRRVEVLKTEEMSRHSRVHRGKPFQLNDGHGNCQRCCERGPGSARLD